MSRADRPVMHGRDHRPGGVDPIPGLLAAPATLAEAVGADDPQHWWRFQETAYGSGAVPPAVANVATASGATSSAVLTGTFTSAASAAIGETIVIAAVGSTGTIPISCTDSKGNSYTIAATASNVSGGGVGLCVAVATAAVTTGDTFTITFDAASTRHSAVVLRVRGVTASPLDRTASNTGNSATTGIADGGTTLTTSQAAEVVIGAFGGGTASGGLMLGSPGPGYLDSGSASSGGTAGTERVTRTIYLVTSSTGTQSPTLTGCGGSQWAGVTVTLKVDTATATNKTPDVVTGSATYDMALSPIAEVTANQPAQGPDSISIHRVKAAGNTSNVWSGAATALTDPSLPFTVEGWFKLDNLTAVYDLFSFDTAGNDKLVVNTDGSLTLTRSGTPHSSAAAAVTANNWVYVAYVYTGTAMRVYVNPDGSSGPVISA